VIDVPDGADVHVRFAAIEFFFGHVNDPRRIKIRVVLSNAPRYCDNLPGDA